MAVSPVGAGDPLYGEAMDRSFVLGQTPDARRNVADQNSTWASSDNDLIAYADND